MHPEEVVSTFRTTRWLEKTFIRSKSAGAASRTAGSKKKGDRGAWAAVVGCQAWERGGSQSSGTLQGPEVCIDCL
jgi:phosphodiesterase/alkaline phosphatase D-like protein